MDDPEETVAKMGRRQAHALHALLATIGDTHQPPTAAEVCVFDAEASGPRSTAAALRSAFPLAVRSPGGFWVAANAAYELRTALEDRFLADTEREGDL